MARLGKRERSFWAEAVKQAVKKAKVDGLEFAQSDFDSLAKDMGRASIDLFEVLKGIAKGQDYELASNDGHDVIKTGVTRPSRLGKDYKSTGFQDGKLINFYDQIETDAAKESRARRLDWLTEQPGVKTRKSVNKFKQAISAKDVPQVERKHPLPSKPKDRVVTFCITCPKSGKVTPERLLKLKALRDMGYKVRVTKARTGPRQA